MDTLILGMTQKTKSIEETIDFLTKKGFPLQSISLVMVEEDDIPTTYFQKMDLIDDVVGSKEGIVPVALPDIENDVFIGGPVTALWGVSGADESYDADNTIIGALAGGMVNALMDIGVSEEDAKAIKDGIQNGSILLGVSTTQSKKDEVIQLFTHEKMNNITAVVL